MTATFDAIREADERAEQLRRDYLRHWGWSETCNTPGSFWMWRRDFSDVDADHRQWWLDTCAKKPSLGNPSEPRPYGVVTAPAEIAVQMTLRELDVEPVEDADAELT